MNILIMILFVSSCYFRKDFNSRKGYGVLDEIKRDILIWDLLKENGISKELLLYARKDPKIMRRVMLCDLKGMNFEREDLIDASMIPIVTKGFFEIVRGDIKYLKRAINKLLSLGMDLYALDTLGKSALFYAVIFNCKEIVSFLLEKGGSVFLCHEYNSETIIDVVVNLYRNEILEMILKCDNNLIKHPRYVSILPKVVDLFIRLKDINPNLYNEDRMLSIFNIILENGFDFNSQDNFGKNLHDMVRKLSERGYNKLYIFLNFH